MLDEAVKRKVDSLSEVHFIERRKEIGKEISNYYQNEAAHGAYNSSSTVLLIKELCEKELNIRTEIVWDSLKRVVKSNGAVSAEELKEFIASNINSIYQDLTIITLEHLKGILPPEFVSIEETKKSTLLKYAVEADLFIEEQSVNDQQPITINNSTGIQIGNGNTQTNSVNVQNNNHVFKNIRIKLKNEIEDVSEREVILEKLQNLQSSIGTEDSFSKYQEFINSVANHMTILAPFIPILTQLVK